MPIKTDESVTEDDLKTHHILLVGRPESNAAMAGLIGGVPVKFGATSFTVDGDTFGHASSAVIAAGPSPKSRRHEVVVFAGNGAEATWRCVESLPGRHDEAANVVILPVGSKARSLVVRAERKDGPAVSLRDERGALRARTAGAARSRAWPMIFSLMDLSPTTGPRRPLRRPGPGPSGPRSGPRRAPGPTPTGPRRANPAPPAPAGPGAGRAWPGLLTYPVYLQ